MANRRLTQRLIDTLAPDKSVREFRDANLRGFGVRILPSGRKRYFVHAQFNGRRVWTAIGDADVKPVAEARETARSHLKGLRNGSPSHEVKGALIYGVKRFILTSDVGVLNKFRSCC